MRRRISNYPGFRPFLNYGLLAAALMLTRPAWTAQLAVNPVDQEQGKWCWAACAQMVIEYIERPGVHVKQCDLASTEWGGNCCSVSAGASAPCMQMGAFPVLSFQDRNLTKTVTLKLLSWNKIKKQIDGDKPLLLSWYWNRGTGDGHMVVIHGYGTAKKKKVVYRLDPSPRPEIGTESYMVLYEELKKLDHWQTWYDIQKN